jgi:hypothetical protein
MSFKRFYFSKYKDDYSDRINKTLDYEKEQVEKNAKKKKKSKQVYQEPGFNARKNLNQGTPQTYQT